MAQQFNPEELASFKELLISGMIEIQTVSQLLFEKGIITQSEYDVKLKQVQAEYLRSLLMKTPRNAILQMCLVLLMVRL
jgi:hypothetical protein